MLSSKVQGFTKQTQRRVLRRLRLRPINPRDVAGDLTVTLARAWLVPMQLPDQFHRKLLSGIDRSWNSVYYR